MRRIVPVVLAISVIFCGCKAKELVEKANIAKDLEKRGTVDLMKEVSKDKYDPPKDGKLTDAQVQMCLKVREHEKDIAKVAKQQLEQHADAAKKSGDKSLSGLMEGFKGLSSAAEFITADIRAAKDLGFNSQEYLWVKGKILEASTAAMAQKMGDAMSAQMDATYQQMKKAYDEAKDEQTKAMYKQTLDSFEQQKKEAAAQKKDADPAVAYNQQLLSKYENALNAFTNEMSKFENKEGETQKSMEQWQKDMEKATTDAKKKSQ
jgi:hypothetical protein